MLAPTYPPKAKGAGKAAGKAKGKARGKAKGKAKAKATAMSEDATLALAARELPPSPEHEEEAAGGEGKATFTRNGRRAGSGGGVPG